MAIRRVLRYLLRTMDYVISYSGKPPILKGYSDICWITNEEDNSSTNGWVFIHGEFPFHDPQRNKHVYLIPLCLRNL